MIFIIITLLFPIIIIINFFIIFSFNKILTIFSMYFNLDVSIFLAQS